jgi:hypothetical protein
MARIAKVAHEQGKPYQKGQTDPWLRVAEMPVVLKIPETTQLRRREGAL